MQDFLLELGFEELPARFVESALGQLSEAVVKKLAQARLSHGEVLPFSTPRRLSLLIKDLQVEQDDLVEEVKGPPKNIAQDADGNLTKAGQGFLRSQGVDESAITIKQFQGADYLFIKKEVQGQKTAILLKPLVEEAVTQLNFPKNMRWGSYDLRYARPLRWIVALFGTEVVPVQIGPITGGLTTWGHRQLSSGPITITKPSEYVGLLKEHYVLPDANERRSLIWEQIQSLSQKEGAKVEEDQNLLTEVCNLVEYPTVFCGRFSPDYLSVPSEVLITSMKEHQRYFPLHNKKGELLPKFIGVRNGADNHLETVVRGNEKVLEARLSDAKFFFDEDLQNNLANNLEKLERVVFQDGLGMMGAKVGRIQRLAVLLADKLGFTQSKETIERTALLAKSDLVSQMVYEFPELQGVMGEKYALAQGEDSNVAQGIREHYKPRFSGDSLPNTIEGTVVSLADKLDTLVGYFALGRIPTGSQDPFALRRQAQGIVQILLQKGYHLPLRSFIALGAQGYQDVKLSEEHAQTLFEFFLARLRVLLLDQGYAYDIIDAVMASGVDSIPSLLGRVEALTKFRSNEGYGDLLTGFERVANLASKWNGEMLETTAFTAADQEFHDAIIAMEVACKLLLADDDYFAILTTLAQFRAQVDRFFDEVMIMDSDLVIRSNRLALLHQAHSLYVLCGDLRQIVVNK